MNINWINNWECSGEVLYEWDLFLTYFPFYQDTCEFSCMTYFDGYYSEGPSNEYCCEFTSAKTCKLVKGSIEFKDDIRNWARSIQLLKEGATR